MYIWDFLLIVPTRCQSVLNPPPQLQAAVDYKYTQKRKQQKIIIPPPANKQTAALHKAPPFWFPQPNALSHRWGSDNKSGMKTRRQPRRLRLRLCNFFFVFFHFFSPTQKPLGIIFNDCLLRLICRLNQRDLSQSVRLLHHPSSPLLSLTPPQPPRPPPPFLHALLMLLAVCVATLFSPKKKCWFYFLLKRHISTKCIFNHPQTRRGVGWGVVRRRAIEERRSATRRWKVTKKNWP